MLIATNDWLHDNYIIKSIIAAFGWALGWVAIATYLVSIFKVLPRLALNQHTILSIDADLPECHLTANRFIPSINSVLKIYWTYTIAILVYTLTLAILRGYYQGIGERALFNITHGLIGFGLGISAILGIVCFIKYGRLIIKLLYESATLIGLTDVRNSQRKTSCLKNYHVHLKKLKIMNFSLLVIVCWCGFIGCFIALMEMVIEKYMPLYVTLGAISLDGTPLVLLITLLGIIYGEVHKQYSAQAEEITTSINYSEVN
ncbi:663_t:CDS:2 [Dentiscutata erythropus]|uniref:663_t:CDS:1 n=1 Tax=Dentiscutata erythropus TaxID=1348616 RepID=A0A9N9ET70_9GLOM|nr:663_t:CDS:2 [Dentiscutata erythropus]